MNDNPFDLWEQWAKSLLPLNEDDTRLSRVSFLAGYSAARGSNVASTIVGVVFMALVAYVAYLLIKG